MKTENVNNWRKPTIISQPYRLRDFLSGDFFIMLISGILYILLLFFVIIPSVSAVNPLFNINCNYPATLIDTKVIDCSFTSSSTDKFPVFFIFTINDNNNGTIEQGEFNITSVDFDNMPLTAVYNATYENYNNSWVITNNTLEINATKGEHKLNITINISEVADTNNYTLETHIVSGLYLLSLSEETTSSSSSGGGGSSFSSNVFNLDLVSKIEINVKEGHSIFFLFNKKTHTLKLNKIEDNKALMTISSTPTSFWLEIGKEWAVNLDGKLIYAGLSEINNKTALISLNKEPKAIIPIIQEPEVNKTEQKEEVEEEPIEKEAHKMPLWLVILIILTLLILIFKTYGKIMEEKKKENKFKSLDFISLIFAVITLFSSIFLFFYSKNSDDLVVKVSLYPVSFLMFILFLYSTYRIFK